MALFFRKHPQGPELPSAFKDKKFSSYARMANFADANELPAGRYWIRNDKGTNLWTAMRELTYREQNRNFYVGGRGNV